MPKKNKTKPALVRKLDRVFSQWIRQRDADDTGFCTCITCGARAHWKRMHAGHYVPRHHMRCRWVAENVHAQCPRCNTFHGGEPQAYRQAILNRYGKDAVERLEGMRGTCIWTFEELEDMIREFSQAT